MTAVSNVTRAKAGDPDAIAYLLNQVFATHGITVRGDRQSSQLGLCLESQNPVDQDSVINTIRQGMERLRPNGIRTVQIHYSSSALPQQHWSVELAMNEAAGDRLSTSSSPESPPSALDRAYRTLQIEPGEALDTVRDAYLRLKTNCLRQGDRASVAPLKAAYTLIQESFQEPQEPDQTLPSPSDSDPVAEAIATLPTVLREHGLEGQGRLHHNQLQIRLEPASSAKPNRAVAAD